MMRASVCVLLLAFLPLSAAARQDSQHDGHAHHGSEHHAPEHGGHEHGAAEHPDSEHHDTEHSGHERHDPAQQDPAPAAPAGRAADAWYDPREMAAARHMLMHHHGGQTVFYFEGERFEFQSHNGEPLFLWDAQGYVGGDRHRFWVKTEGEVPLEGGEVEEAEVQALYSYAIGPWFDLQAGIRHDFAPEPSRTFAVLGVQGLLPWLFEVDAALFVSDEGEISARLETEYEFLLTQRLILQPRAELDFAVQEVAERGIGSGLSTVELGARLRYEIVREFAPYIGVEWQCSVGDTAAFARAGGESASTVSFVAGVRFWY